MTFTANNSLRKHSKRHKPFVSFILFLALSVVVGCSESTSPLTNYNGCLDASYSLWTNDVDPTLRNVHGYMESAEWRSMGFGGSSQQQFITAKFCEGNTGALAENLQLNGNQLYGDTSLYISIDPVEFGDYHRWYAEAEPRIPSISDSILSPNPIEMSYPAYLSDTVSRSGFTIKHDNPGTDEVTVYIYYDPEKSREYDPTIKDSVMIYAYPIKVKATGSVYVQPLTFEPNLYSPGFPKKGVLLIIITAMRKKVITVSGKTYVMRSGVLCRNYVFFK